MSSRSRITAVALAIMVAGAAALVAAGSAAPRGRVVKAVDSLPWEHVLLDGRPLSSTALPAAVLYVLPSCEHCDSAAVTFAGEIGRAGISGLIISASGRTRAEDYRRRLNLPPLGTDSTLAFARAAGIRAAPVVGRATGDGLMAFVPLSSPSLIRHYIRNSR